MAENQNQSSGKLAVSVAEFAEMLSISRPTAYEIIRRADFKGAFKVGTKTLISVEGARKWIEQQTEEARL